MPVFLLSDEHIFPPVHLATPEGLLAVGGDLSPQRLLLAYQKGIFPWFSVDDPILWWSPDPRLILYPKELRISRSLKKHLRKKDFHVTSDTCFEKVIKECADIRIAKGQGTWITTEMVNAYVHLHRMGFAHSIETWFGDKLVGGLYGVSLGRCFFGESMFSNRSNASKIALVHLADYLVARKYDFIDCQVPTNHLKSLGAREIPRKKFISQLHKTLQHPTQKGLWMLT